jgi:hypothetical protein
MGKLRANAISGDLQGTIGRLVVAGDGSGMRLQRETQFETGTGGGASDALPPASMVQACSLQEKESDAEKQRSGADPVASEGAADQQRGNSGSAPDRVAGTGFVGGLFRRVSP